MPADQAMIDRTKSNNVQIEMLDEDKGFIDQFLKEINIIEQINSRFEQTIEQRTIET